jgi:hypothetical protein
MADEAPPVLSMHGRATAAAGAALVAAAVVNPLDVIKVRLDMVQAVAAMLHMTVCDSSMSVCAPPRNRAPHAPPQTRIQVQAMAAAAGAPPDSGGLPQFRCVSTLYE